jgi:hypothetical protein
MPRPPGSCWRRPCGCGGARLRLMPHRCARRWPEKRAGSKSCGSPGGGLSARAVPSQVTGQGLRDVPVVPELRFAPRRTWPRIPGSAARGGATDPGLALWCSFFHRQMSRCLASAGIGDCLHESAPVGRSGRVCTTSSPSPGFKRLPGATSHVGMRAARPPQLGADAAFVTHCGPPPCRVPALFPAGTGERRAKVCTCPRPAALLATRGISHRPGIAHLRGGSTPTRRTSAGSGRHPYLARPYPCRRPGHTALSSTP